MKLSVSVPDELWERAQTARPDLNNSHLVQEALEQIARPAETAGFSLARPAGAEEGFAKAKEQLAASARADFETGYQAAVDLVPHLEWWNMQSLIKHYRFDVKGWVRGYTDSYLAGQLGHIPKDEATDGELIRPFIDAFGNLVSPFGDNSFAPSIPYLRGAAQAFRELWAAVNTGEEPALDAPAGGLGNDEEGASGS